mmetsp:Transcript_22866/g.66024  ORF Transcript_22866/g.66024 Transcript_22866/m.66024 type:complete len:214 (-) Transcript_22866:127-768(-)
MRAAAALAMSSIAFILASFRAACSNFFIDGPNATAERAPMRNSVRPQRGTTIAQKRSCPLEGNTGTPSLVAVVPPCDHKSATTMPPGNGSAINCTGRTEASPTTCTSHSAARPTAKSGAVTARPAVPRISARTGDDALVLPFERSKCAVECSAARASCNSIASAARKAATRAAAASLASGLSARRASLSDFARPSSGAQGLPANMSATACATA